MALPELNRRRVTLITLASFLAFLLFVLGGEIIAVPMRSRWGVDTSIWTLMGLAALPLLPFGLLFLGLKKVLGTWRALFLGAAIGATSSIVFASLLQR